MIKQTKSIVRITISAKGSGNRCDVLDIFEVMGTKFHNKYYATFLGKVLQERACRRRLEITFETRDYK